MKVGRMIYIVIYSLLLLVMLAAEVLFVGALFRLNMLPDLYMAVLIGLLALLSAGVSVLLFVCRKGKRVGVVRQIVACILAAVTVAGCVYLRPKTIELQETVEKVAEKPLPTAVRSVYVRTEDPAQTVQDLAGYTFGALLSDEYCVGQVVAALENTQQEPVSITYYENETLLLLAFNQGEINALILNNGQLDIWKGNELFVDFTDTIRSVHTVAVDENSQASENEAPSTTPQPDVEPVSDITNTPFVVYMSGMDGYSDLLVNTRSDVNIIVVVNPVTKQILMVNTPRDYYIVHPWGNGGRDKLTHCGVYGIECSIDALEKLYNVPVNYYMQINFAGFEQLVDAVGGITIHLDRAVSGGDGKDLEYVYVPAGEVTLSGREALVVARDRKHQPGGDNGRGKNQMKIIKAVIGKLTNTNVVVMNYSKILDSLEGTLATNIPAEDISKFVKMQLTDFAQWDVYAYAVTGYDSTNYTYSMPGLAAYVMVPNQTSVDYGSQLIQRVLNGERLTQEDMTIPN